MVPAAVIFILLGVALLTTSGAKAQPLPGGSGPSGPSGGVFERGVASWYGPGFNGKLTASGEVFDQRAFTAAHKTLPHGTVVLVTDEDTGRTVTVKINDRGPFKPGRVIDLSERAAEELGSKEKGLAQVRLEIVGRAPIDRARVA